MNYNEKRATFGTTKKWQSVWSGLLGERGTKRLIIVFDEAMSAECEKIKPSVLPLRSEAEAIGDDTRTDGKEPANLGEILGGWTSRCGSGLPLGAI